ncbi:MAG: hypothetical protein ACM3MB_10025 [Acidobacteriota bacterium]
MEEKEDADSEAMSRNCLFNQPGICPPIFGPRRQHDFHMGNAIVRVKPQRTSGKDATIKFVHLLRVVTTFFIKSLLTSLCQREELHTFDKEGRGEIFR